MEWMLHSEKKVKNLKATSGRIVLSIVSGCKQFAI